ATEIERIMNDTTYGSEALLAGGGKLGAGPVTFQIGASAAEQLSFDASGSVGTVETQMAALGDVTAQGTATTAIGTLNTFTDAVGTARSEFGATINRLDHTINNLESVSQNTQAAHGRIMDA